jgi:hypothetical protein
VKVVDNWAEIVCKAWSVHLTLLAALLDGAALGWSAFTDAVPPMWFMGVSLALSVGAAGVRILDQGLGK